MTGKRDKGQYGYRNYHRNVQLAKVIFGGVMILEIGRASCRERV